MWKLKILKFQEKKLNEISSKPDIIALSQKDDEGICIPSNERF